VATLGGQPATVPELVPEASDAREMLQSVLSAESGAIKRYVGHAELAGEFGEIALKLQLEQFVQDETTHKEEVEKILHGWKD